MTQAFTPELCAHLSSLAPEFEGHWNYVKWKGKINLMCWGIMTEVSAYPEQLIICPAWQVEDVLRNWTLIIQSVEESKAEAFCTVCRKDENKCGCEFFGTESPKIPFGKYTAQKILSILILEGDTAYQKIEEYLWTILK